jgi:hypothetical protein
MPDMDDLKMLINVYKAYKNMKRHAKMEKSPSDKESPGVLDKAEKMDVLATAIKMNIDNIPVNLRDEAEFVKDALYHYVKSKGEQPGVDGIHAGD